MYLFYHFQQNRNHNLYNGFFSLLNKVGGRLEDHNKNIEINFRFFTFFQFLKEILCAQKIITYCWNWQIEIHPLRIFISKK